MKWGKLLLTPVAVAALALSACSAAPQAPLDAPAGSNVLRIGTTSGIDSMNPFVGINEDGYSVWMHMYPSLLQYDTTKNDAPYKGSLAESWQLSEDGLTLTFKIRQGAQWSDGEPLDAEDAAWSLGIFHQFNESVASGWSVGSNITSITAPDPTTLVLSFKEPSALSIYNVATTPLLPEQVWGAHAGGDGAALKTFSNLPEAGTTMVSGGPFILTQYRQGEVAVFETNPNWYGEKPKVAGFGLQTYKVADAMITALAAGNLDAAYGVPPTALSALEAADVTISTEPALVLRDLLINSNPDKPKKRELLLPNVRKALEHAVNRAEIVEIAWVGRAEPGDSILPPVTSTAGQMWYNDDLRTISYDLDEANRLLDAEGLTRGSDGVRLADGERMQYEVIFADDESGPGDRAFQIIKADFEKIGIVITQRKLDASAAWDAIYCGDDCQYRDFDLAMWNWHPARDPNFLMSSLTCQQWGSWNDVGYCDKDFDELNERQRMAIDPVERKAILDEMQQKIYDDRPYIVLTYDQRIDAWSKGWDGLVPTSQGFFNNWSTQSLESAHRR